MKLLVNSSYGYQIRDRSPYTLTRYVSDGKRHGAINNKKFKRLGYKNDQLYEVELVKSEIERKKTTHVGCFILQYAKLRMLELYYNFFDKYCGLTKFEELYPALTEHDLYDCIRPAKKEGWNSLRSGDCTYNFSANSTNNFVPRTCCAKYKKHDRREPGYSKKNSALQKRFVCIAKHIAVMTHYQKIQI